MYTNAERVSLNTGEKKFPKSSPNDTKIQSQEEKVPKTQTENKMINLSFNLDTKFKTATVCEIQASPG